MLRSAVPTVPAQFRIHDVVRFQDILGSPAYHPTLDDRVGLIKNVEWSPGDYQNGGSWRYEVCFGNLVWDVGECNLRQCVKPMLVDLFKAGALDVTSVVLLDRIRLLEQAIKEVVTQEWDDICWLDVYRKLASLVGVEFSPKMIPADKMKANCARFVDSLLQGTEYEKDTETKVIEEHHQVKQLLREAGFGVTGTPLLDTVKEVLSVLNVARAYQEHLKTEDLLGKDNEHER